MILTSSDGVGMLCICVFYRNNDLFYVVIIFILRRLGKQINEPMDLEYSGFGN